MTVLPEHILKRMSADERKKFGKSGLLASEGQAKIDIVSERKVHSQIENWLRQRGIFFIHSRTDKRTTNAKGVPDFLFAWWSDHRSKKFHIPAEPVAIEVKVNGNTLSPEQLAVKAQMEANGWNYLVVSSLDELRVYLDVAPQA